MLPSAFGHVVLLMEYPFEISGSYHSVGVSGYPTEHNQIRIRSWNIKNLNTPPRLKNTNLSENCEMHFMGSQGQHDQISILKMLTQKQSMIPIEIGIGIETCEVTAKIEDGSWVYLPIHTSNDVCLDQNLVDFFASECTT